MARTPADDPVLAELRSLENDLVSKERLEGCSALLDLVPDVLLPSAFTTADQALALLELFKAVISRAFTALRSDSNITAGRVMAAAAMFGLVTDKPDRDYSKPPSAMSRRVLLDKKDRQDIAGSWLIPPLSASSYRHGRAGDALRAFRHAVLDLPHDQEAISRLATELAGRRPAIPRAVAGGERQRPPNLAVATGLYISRPHLEAQFKSHVESGAKLIVFHGFPGMGKTWLARATLQEVAGEPVPEILVEAAGIATRSLTGLLSRYQIDSGGLPAEAEREALARLLGDEKAPAFLLIDNLDSVDDLARLLPPLSNIPRTVVVATCRAKSEAVPAARFIDVDRMSDAEAEQLIRSTLPALSSEDIGYLASELEAYPLALHFAAGILRYQLIDVVTFCRELKANAKDFAVQAPVEHGGTLLALLVRLIELVRERDQIAYELLRFISLVRTMTTIEDGFLRNYLQWTHTPRSGSGFTKGRRAFSQLLYANGIAVLDDFGLIDQVIRLPPDEPPVVSYTIHSLARAMLRELFLERSKDWAEVSTDVLSFIVKLNEETKRPEDGPYDLGMAIVCGLEFLCELLIEIEDDLAMEALKREYPWLERTLASVLLTRLDSEWHDEMYEEFIYDIPLRWYQWAVSFIQEHKEYYPNRINGNYDRLMEIAKRFGLQTEGA